MSQDSVLFVGTSDALPGWDRAHASYLLRFQGQTILMDCGEPAAKTLAMECVDFGSIDAIVISHLHPDHVAGMLQVIVAMWLEAERKRDLPVYMPEEGIDTFRRLIHTTYLFPELIKFNIDFRPWHTRQPVQIGAVQVTPYPTTHLDSIRKIGGNKHGIPCEPFLLEITGNGKRLIYSGDLGKAHDLEPVLDRPANLLISECAHFGVQSLFELLQGKPLERIAMTHLSRKLWAEQKDLPEIAGRYGLSERLTIARDGMRVEF